MPNRLRGNAIVKVRRTLRELYRDEFDQLREEVIYTGPQQTRRGRYQLAETTLAQRHGEEVISMMADAGYPPTGRSGRTEIDATDALILFNRGMNARQIAEYDNCTVQAVLEALVPLLARKRSSHAAWFDMSAPKTSASDIAVMLGCQSSTQVERILEAA